MSQNDNQLPSNSHSPRQPPQNDTQSTAPQQQQDGVQSMSPAPTNAQSLTSPVTPDLIALIQHIHTENTRLYTQIQSETTRLYQQIQHEHTQLYQQIQTENTRLYQQLQAENARRDHMLMQSLETLQNLSHGLQSYVESGQSC
jgi:D-ribose pyranose/furanose isomerase RbsD